MRQKAVWSGERGGEVPFARQDVKFWRLCVLVGQSLLLPLPLPVAVSPRHARTEWAHSHRALFLNGMARVSHQQLGGCIFDAALTIRTLSAPIQHVELATVI